MLPVIAAMRVILTDEPFRSHVTARACAAMPDARESDAWIADAVVRIARNFAEDHPEDLADESGDWDQAYSVADHLSDCANAEGAPSLLAWFASHPANHFIVDQANEDYGTWDMLCDDVRERKKGRPDSPELLYLISLGQLWSLRLIAEIVIACARKRAIEQTALAAFETTGAL